jgi:hypothetical protein
MYSFDEWIKYNKPVLKHLFNQLSITCEEYGIHLINDKGAYRNFYLMMYNESTKEIVDRELYSEFFQQKFNSKGYEEYTILDIKT